MVSSARRALDGFSPATRGWFTRAFSAPTAAQAGAWNAIREGSDVLVVAPYNAQVRALRERPPAGMRVDLSTG